MKKKLKKQRQMQLSKVHLIVVLILIFLASFLVGQVQADSRLLAQDVMSNSLGKFITFFLQLFNSTR